jgi:hypothetical protein
VSLLRSRAFPAHWSAFCPAASASLISWSLWWSWGRVGKAWGAVTMVDCLKTAGGGRVRHRTLTSEVSSDNRLTKLTRQLRYS